MPLDPTDLDINALRRALAGRAIGDRALYYRSLDSTMDEAGRLAAQGEPQGTVVVAEEQTAGRGRFQREWVSPPGENLSFSVILRPTPAQLPYLNMAATLAVSDAVSSFTGRTATVKWPNDVRVGGRKISGILIETSMDTSEVAHTVVGVGLNVNLDPSAYPEIADTATSLLRETGRRMDRRRVLTLLLEKFDDLFGKVSSGRSLTADWSAQLDTLGRTVQVRWGERVLEGRAESVDEQGNLVLLQPDGTTIKATAGEVTLQV